MGHHDLGHSFGHHSGHHGHHSSHHGHRSVHHGHHFRHHGHLKPLVRTEHGLGYHYHGNDHTYDHTCSICCLTMFGLVLLIGGIIMAVVLQEGLSTLGIVVSVVGFLLFVGGIIGGNISRRHVSPIVLVTHRIGFTSRFSKERVCTDSKFHLF